MSLVTIAVVSNGNFPLYLRDFIRNESSSQNKYGLPNDDMNLSEEEDPFGFFERQKVNPNDSSSLKNQVCFMVGDPFNVFLFVSCFSSLQNDNFIYRSFS